MHNAWSIQGLIRPELMRYDSHHMSHGLIGLSRYYLFLEGSCIQYALSDSLSVNSELPSCQVTQPSFVCIEHSELFELSRVETAD